MLCVADTSASPTSRKLVRKFNRRARLQLWAAARMLLGPRQNAQPRLDPTIPLQLTMIMFIMVKAGHNGSEVTTWLEQG